MKFNRIILPLLATLALSSCSLFKKKSSTSSSNSGGAISSETNYDSDPINPITSSGDPNDYDDDFPSEDPIETPEE